MNNPVILYCFRFSVLLQGCLYLVTSLSLAACMHCRSIPVAGFSADKRGPTPEPVRETVLSYGLDYGIESYSANISFDVLFADGSTASACTARIRGKYGDPVPSDALRLSGGRLADAHPGQLALEYSSRLAYFVSGVIHRPDTDRIHDQNLRALTLTVEDTR